MYAIGRQQYQYDEIGNQQRHVERVGVIQTLEGFVEEMLANVLPKTARNCNKGQSGKRNGQADQGGVLVSQVGQANQKPLLYLKTACRLVGMRT
jgi:hypothetical protein